MLLKIFSIRGRLSLKDYRAAILRNLVCFGFSSFIICEICDLCSEPAGFLESMLMVLFVVFIAQISFASVKRFHDLGHSGWELLPHHSGDLDEWKIWKALFFSARISRKQSVRGFWRKISVLVRFASAAA